MRPWKSQSIPSSSSSSSSSSGALIFESDSAQRETHEFMAHCSRKKHLARLFRPQWALARPSPAAAHRPGAALAAAGARAATVQGWGEVPGGAAAEATRQPDGFRRIIMAHLGSFMEVLGDFRDFTIGGRMWLGSTGVTSDHTSHMRSGWNYVRTNGIEWEEMVMERSGKNGEFALGFYNQTEMGPMIKVTGALKTISQVYTLCWGELLRYIIWRHRIYKSSAQG